MEKYKIEKDSVQETLIIPCMDEELRSAGAPAPVAAHPLPNPGGGPGRAGAAHGYVLVNVKKGRGAA